MIGWYGLMKSMPEGGQGKPQGGMSEQGPARSQRPTGWQSLQAGAAAPATPRSLGAVLLLAPAHHLDVVVHLRASQGAAASRQVSARAAACRPAPRAQCTARLLALLLGAGAACMLRSPSSLRPHPPARPPTSVELLALVTLNTPRW